MHKPHAISRTAVGSWLILWLFASGAGWTAWPVAAPALAARPDQPAAARFETASCPFQHYQIPSGERIECGYLVVPEDRTQPGGRTIRLAVAIIRTHNPTPAPDPILFLNGGPGYGALDGVDYWMNYASDLRTHRDIILLDQRGTGYSQPSLACTEFRELERATAARRLSLDERTALDVQTALRCQERLAGTGIKLAAYTTASNAADVADLRRALGYQTWNLYGLSYGTRLVLTVLRDQPAGVRSVILDLALPPHAGWWEERAASTERVFRSLFDGCAADAACHARYPNLEHDFYELVDRLNAAPALVPVPDAETGEVRPQLITGESIIDGGFQALYDTGLIAYLPLAIDQIHAGNQDVIAGLAGGLAGDPAIDQSGMWYAIECHDEAPFNDPGRVRVSADAHPRFRDFVLSDTTPAVCSRWGGEVAGQVENEPVSSDVPALLLHGAYDPIHPPAWGQLAASTLSHSFLYILPGSGHGVSFGGCGQELVVRFVATPAQAPDRGCVASMPGPAFVTDVYLNRGVYRAATALQDGDLAPLAVLLVCTVLFASTLVWWPLRALIARRRHSSPPQRGRRARWLAAIVAGLNLIFVIGLVWSILRASSDSEYLLLFGLPAPAAALFVLLRVAAVLSVGVLGFAAVAWWRRQWSVPARIHYTLIAAASVGFVALMRYWRLL